MQVLTTILSADSSTMAIKNSIIGYLNFIIQVHKLLHISMRVFHMIPLPDVTNYSGIISFDYEFKQADSKSVTWLEIMVFAVK